MRVIGIVVASFWLVLAAGGSALAQTAPPVEHYRLDNGLEVLLAPDARVPKVGMALVYRVGGMNEPAGRSGFAHLFEHLMFSGTQKYPNIDETYSRLGISYNASTEDDQTRFLADGLASALPVLLSVEADRMANLGSEVDQTELDLERNVVKNEMRQNVLDSAGQQGILQLRTALFPKPHPYAEAVIGSIADLDAAQLTDVQAFFNAYYVPNNAILALAGNFDVAEVKAQIADTFGRIARGADVPLPHAEAPPPVTVRIDSVDRVSSPWVVLALAGPPVESTDSIALTLAADLLGNYEYGVLRRALIETGIATSAGASWQSGRLGGRLIISATAGNGVSPEMLEAKLREAITGFTAGEFRDEDIQRTRRSIDLAWQRAAESMLGRAMALAMRFDLMGAGMPLLGEDSRVAKMTAADVAEVSRRIMVPAMMSVLTVLPGPPAGYPDVLTASSGDSQPIVAPARPHVDVPDLPLGEPGTGTLPAMETATLSNGIRVVHYLMPSAPVAFVSVSAAGGTMSDPPGKEALIQLVAMLMSRGAGERDFNAFSRAAKDIGADVSGQPGSQLTAVSLSVVPDEFPKGIDLLADAVLRPRFDAAEWNSLKAEVLQGLAMQARQPVARAYRALIDMVFPTEPGKSAYNATVESVSSLTIDDLRAMHAKLFTPKVTTIYSVGPIPLATVTGDLERAFGSWVNDSAGIELVPHPPAHVAPGRKIWIAPGEGETSQSTIFLARPAPALDDKRLLSAMTVASLLGGSDESRLNRVLRKAKGYSYGVNAGVWTNIPTGGLLMLSAPVQADKVGASLAEIFTAFDSLASVPVSELELTRSTMGAASTQAGLAETAGGLLGLVMSAVDVGMTAEELNGWIADLITQTLPTVQAEAEQMASLDDAIIVISGDPAVVLPQLEEIGITDAEILKLGD